MDLNKKRNIAT